MDSFRPIFEPRTPNLSEELHRSASLFPEVHITHTKNLVISSHKTHYVAFKKTNC
jgi:hypothetical protein